MQGVSGRGTGKFLALVSTDDGATRSVHPPGQTFVSEDEYLEITGITREQSGEYECSAVNDVAVPDVRKVKVTVNCECRAQGDGGGLGARVTQCDTALCPCRPTLHLQRQEHGCLGGPEGHPAVRGFGRPRGGVSVVQGGHQVRAEAVQDRRAATALG